jgi:hypothetical protein
MKGRVYAFLIPEESTWRSILSLEALTFPPLFLHSIGSLYLQLS